MKFALLFGANSYEHEISIVSAIALKEHLKDDLVFIFCGADRNFYHIEDKDMKASYFKNGGFKKAKTLNLQKNGFYFDSLFGKKQLEFDICVSLIHGKDGEDGKFASLLEFFDIPYIGPRTEVSVLTYSKLYTKFLAKIAGVKTLDFKVINDSKKPLGLNLPVIIKPTHLGSSIGIKIIKNSNEIEYGIETALEYDTSAIVEPYISGVKEYNLAGVVAMGNFIFSRIEEPQKDEFLDFKSKYLRFSDDKKPKNADISEELANKIKDAFARIYSQGFDGAIIRCDFFVIDNEVYLNEINPVPGSLAYYLFDDFKSVLTAVANSLPKENKVSVKYEYLGSISANK
ncbi:MAG: D-alanine--D-alanine ligase [Campylobacter sp.]|nr:D-alanine--D-alanine ligase [Campylobacter sp.]